MDRRRFDAFATMAATGMTRRRALRGIGGIVAAAAGFLAVGRSGDARGGTGPMTVRQPCDKNCLGRCRTRCKTPQCRRECNDVCELRCDNDERRTINDEPPTTSDPMAAPAAPGCGSVRPGASPRLQNDSSA